MKFIMIQNTGKKAMESYLKFFLQKNHKMMTIQQFYTK